MDIPFYIIWFIAVAFYTIDLTSYFVIFVNTERIDGFQHIQTMSNVSPLVYWIATLSFDVAFFLLVTFLRVGVFKIVDDSSFLGLDASIGVFTLAIILYGISGLLFIYVADYLSNSKEGSYTLFFIFNWICSVGILMFYAVNTIKDDFSFFYKMLILIVPTSNFFLLFIKAMAIFQANTACLFCSEAMKKSCEATFKRKSYLEFASKENPDGLLLELLFLMFDIFFYATILFFINMGYGRYLFNLLKNRMFGTFSTNEDERDLDVKQECEKVQQYKESKSKNDLLPIRRRKRMNGRLPDDIEMSEMVSLRRIKRVNHASLLVDGLQKNYIKWFKPFTAVSGVNFVVEPGECFGLLGVNGAGKSTTLKMLTAEAVPTSGDASIENVKLSANKMQYLSQAGYCPQTNCFIEELTGREMLSMIATMRGVFQNRIERLVDEWTEMIGLGEFQNQRCGTYSPGNQRKLCTAMSLIGDPRVVFLDEPTSGIDPVSRRNLYDVMAQSKKAGQAVILTSHSTEECETLCDRFTMMVSGVMKCIGTSQHLKKQYSQGFSLMIKIKDAACYDNEITALKETILDKFTQKHTVLKDEHRGLLYYQLKDTSLPWSTLFKNMEAVKQRHMLVEDYVLADLHLYFF